MDAGWIAVAVAAMGVSFDWRPIDEGAAKSSGEQPGVEYTVQVEPALLDALRGGETRVIESDVPAEAGPVRRVRVVLGESDGVKHRVARPVIDEATETGVVLPHLERHTVRQQISSGQLESGFAQANGQINQFGQSVNQFGQTIQQGSADAQQAFATTQEQFNQFSTTTADPQRTIGGEVRNGAGRLFERAGSALGRTGEAIGGTARNVRDGVRNILPGRRFDDPPASATVSGGDFQPFSYQTPATAGGATATTAAPFSTSPVTSPPPITNPLTPAPPATVSGSTTTVVPSFTDPSRDFRTPVIDSGRTAPVEQSVVVTSQPRNDLTPVAPPILPTQATEPARPTSEPFFNSTNGFSRSGAAPPATSNALPTVGGNQFARPTNQFGAPAGSAFDAGPALGNSFARDRVQNGQAGFVTTTPADPNTGFTTGQATDGFGRPAQQGFPAFQAPLDNRQFNASTPFGDPRDPFGTTVARPAGNPGFGTPGPGSAPFNGQQAGVLNAPRDLATQQPGPVISQAGLPPQTPNGRDPWTETVLATLVAVGSVGGNLFLGWSYLDARNKYRSALRRTSRTFGRSSGYSED